jgi:hypothetical protein
LLVIAAAATMLTITLTVLESLLKVRPVPAWIVAAIWILVAIMVLVLLCENRGRHTRRAQPGEGDSECQHA